MQQIGFFCKAIRWQNLVFIAITQLLFHFCVVLPSSEGVLNHFQVQLSNPFLILLVFSSICIAAGGYIINDYFDINIDEVNKPHKMIVGKKISRRYALVWHLLLSFTGLATGIFLSYILQNWLIAIGHIFCILLLWFYSTTFKKQLLIGNLVISGLTSWVIIILLVAELPGWWSGVKMVNTEEVQTVARLIRIGMLYAGFAFVLSLVREAVKDMEDIEGDRKEGCRTMPIQWGIKTSKIFTSVWLVVLIVSIIISQAYVLQFGWWISISYIIILVVFPLFSIFKELHQAKTNIDFSRLSKKLKWVMLLGILSMSFFLLYTK